MAKKLNETEAAQSLREDEMKSFTTEKQYVMSFKAGLFGAYILGPDELAIFCKIATLHVGMLTNSELVTIMTDSDGSGINLERAGLNGILWDSMGEVTDISVAFLAPLVEAEIMRRKLYC